MAYEVEMKGITKAFGNGVVANDDVSIHLNRGEILAIVGENGAGKSTLMKVLYGLHRPTAGEIRVKGKACSFRNPSDAMAAGIGMVQQHFMLFEEMTVAENIVFKNEIHSGPFMNMKKTFERVQELSDRYQLKIDPRARIADCPVGLRQRVEILKILYQDARIIIFDEPSAVLTPLEVEALLETMKNLAGSGRSIILITHKLNEVMAVADRVYVMRRGKVVAERLTRDTDEEELAFLMVGRQIAGRQIPSVQQGEPLLEVRGLRLNLEGREVLHGIDLHVDAGEIVGIAGVSGNGQSQLISCITGLLPACAGQVLVKGEDVTNRPVRQIRDAGLAHIPEDRYQWGCASEAALEENTLMSRQDEAPFCKRGMMDYKRVRKHAVGLIRDFDVKASSPGQKMRELSGGNAQKLILARELNLDAEVLICAEPTRGVDVGAMEAIHDRLLKKRSEGAAILLISSELTEIMSLSDRIYVIFEGNIRGEFRRDSMDDKHLGLLMLGGTVDHE
ncbi:MAG: ABC transporter ATP-binding protein [Clostridiales bacterium]|jgi:simple sugar transport system ATP-binding protein|nr:ABC transporter ATP-binding protein [Clostridiales bacterium]